MKYLVLKKRKNLLKGYKTFPGFLLAHRISFEVII